VLHEIRRRPNVSRIIRADVSGKEEPIASDAGVDGQVLFAIGSAVHNWIAYDARPDLEAPQDLSRSGIGGAHPPVERAVEHDVTGSRDGAAPHGIALLDCPDHPSNGSVPRLER